VVSSSVRSPLRSKSALVATVVPILTKSILSAGMESPGDKPSSVRMACTAASSYLVRKTTPRNVHAFQALERRGLVYDRGQSFASHVNSLSRTRCRSPNPAYVLCPLRPCGASFVLVKPIMASRTDGLAMNCGPYEAG